MVLLILACGVGLFAFGQGVRAADIDTVTLETGIAGETEIPVQGGITTYIKLIYQFASGIVAGLAAIMIVIGGIQYATAAGNPKAIASAKETIISAIIGLVIVATGYLILGLFGTQFTNLSDPTLPDASYDKEPPSPWTDCRFTDPDPSTGYCATGYVSVDYEYCSGTATGSQICCCKKAEEPPATTYNYEGCDTQTEKCVTKETTDPNSADECANDSECTQAHGRCYDDERLARSLCRNGYIQSGEYWCCKPAPPEDCKGAGGWCYPGECCAGYWCKDGTFHNTCTQSWR